MSVVDGRFGECIVGMLALCDIVTLVAIDPAPIAEVCSENDTLQSCILGNPIGAKRKI